MDGRALDTAIYSKFNAATNSFKTAMGGRFYNTAAPVNAVKPYSVYTVISCANRNTFNAEIYDVLLKISIFDETNSKLTINDHVQKCCDLFDRAHIAVTGHGTVTFVKDNIVNPFLDEYKLWNAHIFFNFLFED